MHLLYLSVPGGGLETNVRVLAPALVQAGHEVSILYLDAAARALTETRTQGVTEYRAPVGSKHYYLHRATFGIGGIGLLARAMEYGFGLARALRTIHARQPLDLVELPESYLPARLPAPFVMRLHSPAWLWRMMCREPIPRTDALEIRWEARTLAHAAAITAPSRAVADYIARTCRVARPIEIIPYPVNTKEFKPCTEISHCVRNDKAMVLFVGRVEKRKGADTLLRAIPKVLDTCPDCEFLFAGRMSEELEQLAATMPPQVKFLGVKPRTELIGLYQRANVVVVPSQWDNSPNVIYEAMACGVPVVATRVGGIPELVEDGVTGMLVPPGDENALGNAILKLLDDSNLSARLGREARARAVQNFALGNVLAQTLELYERVLS